MRTMRIAVWCAIICMLICGHAFGTNPPHPRILKLIRDGKIKLPYFLKDRAAATTRGINAIPLKRPAGFKPYKREMAAPSSTFKAIALLVQFSDQPAAVPAVFFDSLLYAENGPSLRDYYSEVSYGTFDIVTVNFPSSVGWLTAPQPYSYYVNHQYGWGDYPNNSQKLAEDAIIAADPVVDFSQYDNNGDGYVDALFIICTGQDASWTGDPNDMWPHAWCTSTPVLVDGIYAFDYSVESEYIEVPGDRTIGVFAHEMGHSVFWLPDLYDYDYDSRGLGGWSLMAYGSWCGPTGMGESPSHPDAWSRWQMGFVTPTNIVENVSGISIPAVKESGVIYKLWTNGSTGLEYFLVENRQRVGYDAYLEWDGLCIYHVDESQPGNDNQWYPGYTDFGHYKVALEQADGLWELEKGISDFDPGDPFPGSTGNTTFDMLSSPGSGGYAGNQTYVGVRNISLSAPTMTADFEVTHTFTTDGEFLVWNPDPTPMSGQSILYLLDSLGVNADLTADLSFITDLSIYKAIFVFLGVCPNGYVLQEDEASRLVTYLNGGGRVFMEGGDTWAFDPQTSLHPYFSIQGLEDGTGDLTTIAGVSGTLTAGMSFPYSGENSWIDRLVPVGSAFSIFTNSDVGYVAGVAYDQGTYKTIGTSFEFGGLDDDIEPSTKLQLLRNILTYFLQYTILPASLNYGDVLVASSKQDSVTVTNGGTAALSISSVTSTSGEFTVTPTSGSVAPSESQKFYVTFSPSSTGAKSGDIIFTHNASGSPDTVVVSGTGVAPSFAVAPTSLNYGDVLVGSSKQGSVTVTNGGTAALSISSVTSTRGEFTVTPTSGSVAPSGSQKFYITFTPTAAGAQSGIISFTHNASGSPHSVSVSGTGFVPPYTITSSKVGNGTIEPEGEISVENGSNQSFTITPAIGHHIDSVVVDGVQVDSTTSCTFTNVTANHTIRAVFAFSSITMQLDVRDRWNMVSVPLLVEESRKDSLFSTAVSNAFAYENGYVQKDTLTNGIGYWLKFYGAQVVTFLGVPIVEDTAEVKAGWNMIGSIRIPVTVTAITTEPGGMSTSDFFGYTGGYVIVDTILPGRGYWVKVNQDGKLILSSLGGRSSSNRIKIVDNGELPPPPPDIVLSDSRRVPDRFALEQNYPNPFNPSTSIWYELPRVSFVTLKVYNVLGQEVGTLVDEKREAGRYEVQLDGSGLPSGMYFYQLQAGAFIQTRIFLLLK